MKVILWLLPSLLVTTIPVFAEGIATDGSMGALQTLTGTAIAIPQALGKTVGNNLFHSFSDFNINTGQTVTFTGSDSLQNVISRVTGNNPSVIDGILKSDIKNADFYFINPHGVTFNTNAQVDVPAAFHVSTADKMDFGKNGEVFYADLSKDSQLSSEPPSAFGFLGNTNNSNGLVDINNTHLSLKDGKTLTDVVSGGISIEGNGDVDEVTGKSLEPTVKSTGGGVRLVAFTGQGNVGLQLTDAGVLPLPSENSTEHGGAVSIHGGYVDTSGDGAGRIAVYGGDVVITHGGLVADNIGNISADENKGINIQTNNLYLNHGHISSSAKNPTDNNGNPLFIAKGNAGNITISANNAVELIGTPQNLLWDSYIKSDTSTDGSAGVININTKELGLFGSYLSSDFRIITVNDKPILTTGLAGTININASDSITMHGMLGVDESGIFANNITLSTKYLDLKGAGIASGNIIPTFYDNDNYPQHLYLYDNYKAGDIKISASESIIMDTMFDEKGNWIGWNSQITSDTHNDNNAGNIYINTKELVLNASIISSSALTAPIFTQVMTSQTTTDSQIITGYTGYPTGQIITNGKAGVIDISANSIKLNAIQHSYDGNESLEPSFIQTDTQTNGDAGLIRINTRNLDLENSAISSRARTVYLNDINEITTGKEPSYNIKESNKGSAGSIMVNANNIVVRGNSSFFAGISSSTYSTFGVAGNVNVMANKISLYDKAEISSASNGIESSGIIGDIHITTQYLMMDGGKVTMENEALLSNANLQELTSSANKIGNINLEAHNIFMNHAQITSASTENIPSGNINIDVFNALEMKNNSFINTTSNAANGGHINFHGGEVTYLQDSGFITTVKGELGNGGNISANTQVLVMDTGIIQANAVSGNGGSIQLALEALIPSRNSLIQGGQSIVWNTSPTNINLIQAASEHGVSGTVNNSAPQLNLSGVLANVTNTTVDNSLISQDYCAQGQGSSLSKKGRGALPMRPHNLQSF